MLQGSSLEFPPSSFALKEPNGLLAFGGDLSVPRLIEAYKRGIFPWFNPGEPILWWTPDPRTVFYPNQVHCSRSLTKFLRKTSWQITLDQAFPAVIQACALPRKNSAGTWITSSMKKAYNALHDAGYAHSIEIWEQETLVGGMYGVALGQAFFGESMFSAQTNASKTALVVLSRFLNNHGFQLLDCQVESAHLFTLGAQTINRVQFENFLSHLCTQEKIDQMQSVWLNANRRRLSIDGHIDN